MARVRLGLAALTVAAGVALAGCRGPEPASAPAPASSATTPVRGGELVASIRSDASTYNRYVAGGSGATTDLVTLLTQARIARVNRATDELEPWLAEGWTASSDGLTYTITLKPNLRFSDGVPFTSADVLFSFQAAYDPRVASSLASGLTVNGKPLVVSAPDPRTVVVRFPEPFAPGLRLLDSLPVLPKHKLESALASGTFADAWGPASPPSDVVGLGPFVLAEHVSGQRLVFARNPHYFRRDAQGVQLPYLDRLIATVVPDQNTEALRLEAGEIDLMANGDIRPQDYAAFQRLTKDGRLKMIEVSAGLDPDFLSFNLRPAHLRDPRAWLARKELRQAISCGVDRQAIVNSVYLGAAVPIYGPISPGNRRWYTADVPSCALDRARARQLLATAGLTDRNGDGMLEDAAGRPGRFSMITQAGHLRAQVASVLQEQLRQIGLAVDVVTLDPQGIFKRWMTGDYDAMYFALQASSTDPALNGDFWRSAGDYHFWNPGQATPATPWEARIDDLMRQMAATPDLARRQQVFADVQRILGEELPSVYFVAPRITLATTPRVKNPTPALQIPQLLWSADTLAAAR